MSQNTQSQKDCEDHCCDETRCESLQETVTGGSGGYWSREKTELPKDEKWICIEVKKVDDPQECEMCGKEDVTYVHVMSHDKYPDLMKVGCSCAAHMTGDDVWVEMMKNPKLRSDMKLREKQRKNFPHYIWKKSKENGNSFIKLRMSPLEESRVIIINKWPSEEEYSFIAKYGDNTNVFLCKDSYDTEIKAQLAAFDYIWPLK
jgi:hypothetical protein